MPKGRIEFINTDRGFGRILDSHDRRRTIDFDKNEIMPPLTLSHLAQGDFVEYDTRWQGRGNPPKAVFIRLIEKANNKIPYRFLNPYNFVHYLPAGKEDANDPDITLLGSCAPPPHDRYVGLSGQITCRLTTHSPFFISDAEGICEDANEHKTFLFFRAGNTLAIPGSSLRGMVRNVFEAVTNSCFSILDGSRQSKHVDTSEGRSLVPAIVEEVSSEEWTLRLLTGSTVFDLNGPAPTPDSPLYAAWLARYSPISGNKTIAENPQTPYAARKKRIEIPDGLHHGDECHALLEFMQHPPKMSRRGELMNQFWFWNVIRLAKNENELTVEKQGQTVEKGYLFLTNQNTENKHDERFFFISKNDKENLTAKLPKVVRERYNDLIKDYQKRHKDEISRRRTPDIPEKTGTDSRKAIQAAYSRFILEEFYELKKDDLVYAKLKKDNHGNLISIYLAPVSLPRIAHQNTIAELLQKDYAHLLICEKFNQLCPACRTFGWVHPHAPEDAETPIAYGGRVSFSHALLEGSPKTLRETIPLAILSSPKPTTTSFYLMKKRQSAFEATFDIDYDDKQGAQLRGRKFYRHHGSKLNRQEFTRPKLENGDHIRDHQNRSVKSVLDHGNAFVFAIQFGNLAAVELGALLWSLEMEEGMYHRLGYAKPLGFGSVRVAIENIEIIDPAERYASLSQHGRHSLDENQKRKLVQLFRDAMAAKYGERFEELDNIKDLRVLLSEPEACNDIHYPRPPYSHKHLEERQHSSPEGKQFEWFMGNKKKGNHLALPLTQNDKQGFPLIDRDGNREFESASDHSQGEKP